MKQITQTLSAPEDSLLPPAATDSLRMLTPDEIMQIGGGIGVHEYPLPPRG